MTEQFFYVVESDGHNADLLHKFRNKHQAAKYIARNESHRTADEIMEIWEEDGTFEDQGMTNWTPDDGKPNLMDHTEDE